jgi:hypothetical protein
VLGKRKRLFDGGAAPADLEVVSSQTKSTGVIMATYWSGAEIKFGSLPAGVPGEAEQAAGPPKALSASPSSRLLLGTKSSG